MNKMKLFKSDMSEEGFLCVNLLQTMNILTAFACGLGFDIF